MWSEIGKRKVKIKRIWDLLIKRLVLLMLHLNCLCRNQVYNPRNNYQKRLVFIKDQLVK